MDQPGTTTHFANENAATGPAPAPARARARVPNVLDFNRTVGPHMRQLRRQAKLMVRNFRFNSAVDGDDLLQETLLRAFRFWGGWQSPADRPGDPRPWLTRVMVSVYCDWYEKDKVRAASLRVRLVEATKSNLRLTRMSNIPTLSRSYMGTVPTPLEAAMDSFSDELRDALDALDPHWRVVFEARVDGDSQEQVAAKLKIPLGTVQSRSFRARHALASTPAVVELARREYGMRAELDGATAP